MSRIADVFVKAGWASPVDPLIELEHPWGNDLSSPLGSGEEEVLQRRPPQVRQPSLASPHQPAGVARGPALDIRRRSTAAGRAPNEEHLLALVERVFLPISGEPTRSVAFLGVEAQSAPITVVVAELLARETAASVCVVDANFTSPSLHLNFGVASTPGLAEALAGGSSLSDAAREVRPNLWLLSAGGGGSRPSFASEAVRVKIAQFIASFDYVLADIAPAAGEEAGLAALLGNVILVVAADATRRETARRSAQTLRACGAAVIGAVLTNRRFPIPEALYKRL